MNRELKGTLAYGEEGQKKALGKVSSNYCMETLERQKAHANE